MALGFGAIGRAVSKIPGMGAITKPINKGLQATPGLRSAPQKLGLGPSPAPPMQPQQGGMGQAMPQMMQAARGMAGGNMMKPPMGGMMKPPMFGGMNTGINGGAMMRPPGGGMQAPWMRAPMQQPPPDEAAPQQQDIAQYLQTASGGAPETMGQQEMQASPIAPQQNFMQELMRRRQGMQQREMY